MRPRVTAIGSDIGTMYGGLGARLHPDPRLWQPGPRRLAKVDDIDAMYNGNMYIGEPDGVSAGGILYKFNVKTGETKILMAQSADEGGTGVDQHPARLYEDPVTSCTLSV